LISIDFLHELLYSKYIPKIPYLNFTFPITKRRPQLLSVRQRQSVCLAEADDPNQASKAFELLLAFCKNTQDIAYLRAHPENLTQLGISNENLPSLFEVNLMSKCDIYFHFLGTLLFPEQM
jgi:hypothetical protein